MMNKDVSSIMKGVFFSILSMILLTMGNVAVYSSEIPRYYDVPPDHWGYEAITKWSTEKYNILLGYGNGKFGPNDNVTAEQIAWICARILGVNEAVAQYEEPGSRALSREEAVAIIAKTFFIDPVENTNNPFNDDSLITDEYRPYVNALKQKKIIVGNGNTFDPKAAITRAEALQVVYTTITDIISASASNINAKGTCIIRSSDITLTNAKIDGDLLIANGAEDSVVILDKVNVGGKLIVIEGGQSSIIIKGSSNIPSITSANGSDQLIRITVEDDAKTGTVKVSRNNNAYFVGKFSKIIAEADTSIELTNANVDLINLLGANSTLSVDLNSIVDKVTVEASNIRITGGGMVKKVEVTTDAKEAVVVSTERTEINYHPDASEVARSSGIGNATSPFTARLSEDRNSIIVKMSRYYTFKEDLTHSNGITVSGVTETGVVGVTGGNVTFIDSTNAIVEVNGITDETNGLIKVTVSANLFYGKNDLSSSVSIRPAGEPLFVDTPVPATIAIKTGETIKSGQENPTINFVLTSGAFFQNLTVDNVVVSVDDNTNILTAESVKVINREATIFLSGIAPETGKIKFSFDRDCFFNPPIRNLEATIDISPN